MNSRYNHFKQKYLTAGDSEQFDSRVDIKNYNVQVKNTFNYIFHKFKKGVFVHIKNNQIYKFVPFCKANFINECWDKLLVDPSEFDSFESLFNYIKDNTFGHKNTEIIYNNKYGWWMNNGLFRYEKPRIEIDKGMDDIYKFIKFVLSVHKIRDCVFFINKRDFPIITKNRTEPYVNIWGENHNLVSYDYKEYCPIFSMTTNEKHSDIPMPTWDDCNSIFNEQTIKTTTSWENKKSIVMFRGSSTGLGTTHRTNPRIRLLKIAATRPELFDVGFTKWNLRPRKLINDKYVRTISKAIIDKYKLKEFKTYQEQSEYKYILNLPGHVTSFRLGTLLQFNSVVLHVQSKYTMWYEKLMKPYIHYIPVKSDLSDLIKQIEWCKKNDEMCKKIAHNAYEFYKKYLTLEGQANYMSVELNKLKSDYISAPVPIKNRDMKLSVSIDMEKLENTFLSKVCKQKSFYIYDCKYILKKNDEKNIEQYHNEYDMYNIYLKKLSCIYGWREIYGNLSYKNNNYTVMKYITKNTFSLYDYLYNMELFDFNLIVECLLQILIILNNAYTTCNFVHNDCVPWNILISVNDFPQELILVNQTDVYTFKHSMYTVHIIDYEKSYISGKQNNDIDMRDGFNIIIHVLFLILLKYQNWPQYVINICTQIFARIFPDANCKSIQDILNILDLFKKYDNMTSVNLKNINHRINLNNNMQLFYMLKNITMYPSIQIDKISFDITKLHKQFISKTSYTTI